MSIAFIACKRGPDENILPFDRSSRTFPSINSNRWIGGTGSPANNSNAGGSNTSTTPTSSSSVSITTSSLPGATVGTPYNSMLASKGGTAPLTWSISAGALPAGLSLASNTGAITGTPTGPASATTVSLTAKVTDSSSPASSATAQLSILVSSPQLSLSPGSTALPAGAGGAAYSLTFTATNGSAPYTFTVTGTLPPGLTGTTSGANFTITGTPTAICNACAFSVQLTDSSAPVQSATGNYTLTIVSLQCGSGSESLINGQYALLAKGFDNGSGTGGVQPALIGGVLYMDGQGGINAGTIDVNRNNGLGDQPFDVTGRYGIGSDHRGCMAIVTSQGVQNYYFSVGNISGTTNIASSVHILDFDAAGPFTTGEMLLQNTAAFSTATGVTGNFAFEMSSPQNTVASVGKTALAGMFTLSNGTLANGDISGNVSGTFDVNAAGVLNGSTGADWSTVSAPLTITGGTYNISSFNGRGGINFSATVNGQSTLIGFSIYVVSANQMLIMGTTDQTQPTGVFAAGQALQQTTGTFSVSSLSGTSVLATSALSSTTPVATLGTITTAGNGTYIFSGWQDNGGAISAQNPPALTVTVDANGRALVSGGAGNPVFWLVGPNEGFYLGPDSTVQTGFFQPQTSTTLAANPYSFGTADPQAPGTDLLSGVETFSGSGVSGTTDDNIAGTPTAGNAFGPFNYSVNGALLGTSSCTMGATGSTGCQVLVYAISPTQAVQMNLLNSSGVPETKPTIELANQ